MPFNEMSIMDQRLEFVLFSKQSDSNISYLCRRYGISRSTGYKWINRFKKEGYSGLEDKSRKPHHQPDQVDPSIEQYIVNLRKQYPEWGGKKLHKLLIKDQAIGKYQFDYVPCIRTIGNIIRRNGLIKQKRTQQSWKYKRFEYAYPNELWQMDFKGDFKMLNKQQCFPLTILDDHSRFNICLMACSNQQRYTVEQALTCVFREYGLPDKILTDNGGPWGSAGVNTLQGTRSFTKLEKWLILLNIKLIHGRPYHPQTQGKEERFHRTLQQELLNYEQFRDIGHCQSRFDTWRYRYNCYRPHEALNFNVPAKQYSPSVRQMPEKIKPFEYESHLLKKKVGRNGIITIKTKNYRVGKAFTGEWIALKESKKDGVYEVYFCNELIRKISL